MTAAMSLVSSVVLTALRAAGRRDAGAPKVAPWSCATGDLPADHTVAFTIAIGKWHQARLAQARAVAPG